MPESKSIFKNNQSAMNYLLLIGSIILVIFFVEIFCYIVIIVRRNAFYNKYDTAICTNCYNVEEDSNLGYVLKKNNKHHASKFFSNGTAIYGVTYTTDEYRRRTVGQKYLAESKHLILFGCSFAYGEGLDDNETLQYMIGKKMRQYNVYNYAVHGYGPQQMLALLETGHLPFEIETNKGLAIYYFDIWHLDRAMGSMRVDWSYDFPYYRVNKDGHLERKDSFITGRPIITYAYKFLNKLKSKSNFLQLINFNLPLDCSNTRIRLTVEIIKESKKQYEKQFNGKFYVLINPLERKGDYYIKQLRRLLEENKIDVLYYPLKIDTYREYEINGDGHPNAKLNEFLTNNLIRDLER